MRPQSTLPTDASPSRPATCAVAFKEWLGVCEALISGRQSLILRKGGVAETDGEFRPDHAAFWLYPTVVHQAEQGLRTPTGARIDSFDPTSRVPIQGLAVVEWTGRVDHPGQLDLLRDWHDWTDATIRGRFDYRRPGLWALVVRVYRRGEPWPLAVTPEHLGCKTWVPLVDSIATDGVEPVIGVEESSSRRMSIRQALNAEGGLA